MEDSLFHQNFCVTDTLLYRNCNRWDWSFISRVLSVGWPSYVGIQQLKIALIAPPFIAVPPADYGGTAPLKGTHIAIDVAQRIGIPLKIAGDVQPMYHEYFERKVKPQTDGKLVDRPGRSSGEE